MPPRASQSKRKRLSGAERRAGLLRAARIVFLENGFAGARTKRIAELAGTTEAILYRHFVSKEELFEAAVLEPVEAMVAQLTESAATMAALDGRAPRQQASYEVQATVEGLMEEVAPLLGTALFSDQEAGTRFYQQRLEPLLQRLDKEMAETLLTWKHKPVTPELISLVHLGTYFWVALQQHFGKRKVNGTAVSRELTDIFVRAL